ncbi:hypothetical protein L6164_017894 [Bauhinia variegata]|nr:hypothetical protein L6164_017894 [Bauhinia variegata]
MIQGEEGVMYDGPDPTMFRITSLDTFEVLKQKIHRVLYLEAANQEVSEVTYRSPISANKYRPVQLKSDDDVKCMFGNHAQHPKLSAIELFIDMNTRQTRLSQTSAGDRSRSQLTVMAARERTIRCSEPVHVSQLPTRVSTSYNCQRASTDR